MRNQIIDREVENQEKPEEGGELLTAVSARIVTTGHREPLLTASPFRYSAVRCPQQQPFTFATSIKQPPRRNLPLPEATVELSAVQPTAARPCIPILGRGSLRHALHRTEPPSSRRKAVFPPSSRGSAAARLLHAASLLQCRHQWRPPSLCPAAAAAAPKTPWPPPIALSLFPKSEP
ncbi:hypothetical protein SESBI_50199 [Sesbania bispinosa]|nr:hypothetical protein SESBI_50199 [Sesbania bispinosa]